MDEITIGAYKFTPDHLASITVEDINGLDRDVALKLRAHLAQIIAQDIPGIEWASYAYGMISLIYGDWDDGHRKLNPSPIR